MTSRNLVLSLLAGSAVLAACGGDPSTTEIDIGGDTGDTGNDVQPLDIGGDSGDAAFDGIDDADDDAVDTDNDAETADDASDGSGQDTSDDANDASDGSGGDATDDAQPDTTPDPVCGDGVVNRDEEDCDGDDVAEATCETLGYLGGDLTCSESCTLVEDACFDSLCGNGTPEAEETCDDGNLDDGDGCSSLCAACEEDPNEPNTGIEDATIITYPSSIEGLVAQSGDEDWFRTFVAPGCLTNFDIVFDGDPSLLTVEVVDFDEVTILATGEANPDGPGIRVIHNDGGDGFTGTAAFARIRPSGAAACVPYTITIRLVCG